MKKFDLLKKWSALGLLLFSVLVVNAQSPIAHWKFDETSGTTAADELSTSNGDLTNFEGDGTTTPWVTGHVDGAIDFAAGTDTAHVAVPNNETIDIDSSESFSISLLVDADPVGNVSEQQLLLKGFYSADVTGGTGKWFGMQFKDGEARIMVDDNITKTQLGVSVGSIWPNSDWVHLVGVRDRSTDSLYLYINGEEVGRILDDTENDIAAPELPLFLGLNHSLAQKLDGKLDDVMIFGQALTSGQIKTMFDEYDIEEALSDNTNISSLTYDGTSVDGFTSSTITYDVALPEGTTAVPSVEYILADQNASGEITNATAVPGTTTIVVTAEDGVATKTYTINFSIEEPQLSDVATLSNLTVNSSTVDGFNSEKTTYVIELAAGTTTVPIVSATATDENATVSVTNATSLPGNTSVLVTAENGETTTTYQIAFTVAVTLSSDLETAFSVYPNPVTDLLNIESKKEIISVNLYSIQGRLIKSYEGIGANSKVLDLSDLGKGIYLIKTTLIDQSVLEKKIIK